MARIGVPCGWELNSATDGVETEIGGTPAISSTTFRSGAYALEISSLSSGAAKTSGMLFAAQNVVFWRGYIRVATAPSAANRVAQLMTTTPLAFIELNADRTVQLNDEDGAIGSPSSALSLNTWHRLEIKIDVSAAAGSHVVEARLDGVVFATASNRSISAPPQRWRVGGNLNSEAQTQGEWYFDDVVADDAAYPGDSKLVVVRPNAAGDNAAVTRGGVDSGSDFGQIDEVTPNDAGDYLVFANNNDTLDLGVQNSSDVGIGASDSIHCVSVGARHRAATAAGATYQLRIKSQASGTVTSGTATTHDDTTWKTNGDVSPRIYTLVSATDPQGGGAWTPALLDTAQIGCICTDATPDLWLTALWAYVEYTPAVGGSGKTPWHLLQRAA
jgi:hypothetical protein